MSAVNPWTVIVLYLYKSLDSEKVKIIFKRELYFFKRSYIILTLTKIASFAYLSRMLRGTMLAHHLVAL